MGNTKKRYSSFTLGDMSAIYIQDVGQGVLGLTLLPKKLEAQFTLEGRWQVEPLVQVKAVGDVYPGGYSLGHTMRNSQTAWKLRVTGQSVKEEAGTTEIVTEFQSDRLRAEHILIHEEGEPYLISKTRLMNPTTGNRESNIWRRTACVRLDRLRRRNGWRTSACTACRANGAEKESF